MYTFKVQHSKNARNLSSVKDSRVGDGVSVDKEREEAETDTLWCHRQLN